MVYKTHLQHLGAIRSPDFIMINSFDNEHKIGFLGIAGVHLDINKGIPRDPKIMTIEAKIDQYLGRFWYATIYDKYPLDL